MQEREAMAILAAAYTVSYAKREAALYRAGSALEIVRHPEAYAMFLGDSGASAVARCARDASSILARLERDGIRLVLRGGEGYPARLMQIARPPHLLYVRGAEICDKHAVAIVGTRKASAYGLRHTRRIAAELAAQGVCVVSGLALGIDTQAHEGALEAGGRTIAVLGTPHDKPYPAGNIDLLERIVASGGSVISEYPIGMPAQRFSFLERNRIVAGLAQGVLVTEGARRSGALSTANYALDEGRDVFALPGDIDRGSAQLPNMLIAEGAAPVGSGREILALLSAERIGSGEEKKKKHRMPKKEKEEPKAAKAEAKPQAESALSGPEKQISDLLLTGDMDFDTLCERTGIGSDDLGALLMMMELDGVIEALPGLYYRHA